MTFRHYKPEDSVLYSSVYDHNPVYVFCVPIKAMKTEKDTESAHMQTGQTGTLICVPLYHEPV